MTWSIDCEAIRQTISAYCQLLDDQRFDEVAELFAVNAVLPWEGRTLTGRAEIRRELATTQRPKGTTRHPPFAPVIEIIGSGPARTALAWTDVLVTVHAAESPTQIAWTGRYHDAFELEDGLWGFKRHIAVGIGETLPPEVIPVPGRRCGPAPAGRTGSA